ncbi:hypothetical protein ACQ4PT_034099 [Festuca glaucescens]
MRWSMGRDLTTEGAVSAAVRTVAHCSCVTAARAAARLDDGFRIAPRFCDSQVLVSTSMADEAGNDSPVVQGNETVDPSNEAVNGDEMIQGNELVQVDETTQGDEMGQGEELTQGEELLQGHELAIAEVATPPATRRRKKKSLVWEHFTIEDAAGGATRACCKLCKQTFAYSSGSKIAGTSHLKRHITLGSCPKIKSQEHKLALASTVGTDNDGDGTVERRSKRRYRYTGYANSSFDQDRSCSYLAKMIILHDYPLHIVQQPTFTAFIDSLQPRFRVADVDAMEGEVYAVYQKEKEGLLQAFSTMPGRISLTIGLWTTSQTLGYVSLAGQFIDSEWKLHRRMLKFMMVSSPHSENALSEAISASLTDWKTCDDNYNEAPSFEDWKKVEAACNYLRLLYDSAHSIMAAGNPTSNIFFHEAWKLQLELANASGHEDPVFSIIAKDMHERFDKYWKDCNLVLAVAVVMDPRLKMKLVEFSYSKIYGVEAAKYVKVVNDSVHELFKDYVAQPLSEQGATNNAAANGNNTHATQPSTGTGTCMLDDYRSSLRPEIVEALVCAKDWLPYSTTAPEAPSSGLLGKME